MGADTNYQIWFIHENKDYLQEVFTFISNGMTETVKSDEMNALFNGCYDIGKIHSYKYSNLSFSKALESRSKPCLPIYADDLKEYPKGFRFSLFCETTERKNVWISSGYGRGEVSTMSLLFKKFSDIQIRGYFSSSYSFGAFGKVYNNSRDWLYGVDGYWGLVCQPKEGFCPLTMQQALDAFNSDGFVPVWFANGLSDEIDGNLGKLLHKKLKKYDVPIDNKGRFRFSDKFFLCFDYGWVNQIDPDLEKGYLELSALTELSEKVAQSLLSCGYIGSGYELNLSGLTKISDKVAEILSTHNGVVGLRGLTSLSDAAAKSLSKLEGSLHLNSLAELSAAAAKSLAQKVLTEEIAEKFLNDEYSGDFGEFTQLEDAAAKSLSKCESGLDLRSLISLSDAAARSLSKNEVFLILDGLNSLSDAAAKSLSKCKGELDLEGLTSLSDAAAESLSKHKGYLNINGLTELSNAGAKSLSKREGELLLEGLFELSDSAAKSLARKDPDTLQLNWELEEQVAKYR